MQNFLKVCSMIFGVTLFLMILLDKSYSYAFRSGQPRSKIQNMLQLENKHYDVAFFGSSRTENHINCELITEYTGKSCINFGISGGTAGDMLILMKLAENRNVTFNQVFMQVDYNYNHFGMSSYFKANLIPFIGEPIVKEQMKKYENEFFYSSIPFYKFMIFDKVVGIREATASTLRLNQNTNINVGFFPKQGIGKAVDGIFPKSIKSRSTEIDLMQEHYLNTNTNIEFFTAPYCKDVKNREFIEKLQLKLPRLRNYIAIFDDKEEFFFNCGHLNEAGANVFTKRLIEDLFK
ncbi:hypothetical protein RM545_01360 [Zunongwangia sp. F260]|uniref:DUF1574 domain-containing protein n=1 Tax=Autumnicola lenta TaxID=3075593 RepID=A0ABU3CG51_9FLAO|nr:hypothetical protein [Zunongwangia sp. F260]MDT0645323.1 hypothetical protein [Zunongwangia sp. F260]